MTMVQPVVAAKEPRISWADYGAALARDGVRTVAGAGGTLWVAYQQGAMIRVPAVTGAPDGEELRRVFRHGRAAVASYLVEPDAGHPANACLYVCRDRGYALDRLAPPMRRNVRRGTSALRVAWLTRDEVLAHGLTAYCDTRRRLGLSDGTPSHFARRFGRRARNPAHVFLGAWKDDRLSGFLSITEVDAYAEIEGSFAADAFRGDRPSDTLLYSALRLYLVERGFAEVSYGLSSIQAESNAVGLHRFKLKVGFAALPVHRAFVSHPWLRPLVHRLTLSAINVALRLRPGDPRLRMAGGILACMLGQVPPLPDAAPGS
jgi:hypothetical protein